MECQEVVYSLRNPLFSIKKLLEFHIDFTKVRSPSSAKKTMEAFESVYEAKSGKHAAVSEDPGGKTLPFKGPLPECSCGETAPGSLFGGGESEVTRSRDWHKNIEGTKMAN